MNKIFILFLLFGNFYGSLAWSQDLVVYNEGDSLNCTILEQNANSVVFSFRRGDESVTRELTRNMFKAVVPGYYKSAEQGVILVDTIQKQITRVNTESSTTVAADTVPISTPAVTDTLPSRSQENTVDSTSTVTSSPSQPTQPPLTTAASGDGIADSRWYVGINGGYATRLFRMQIKYTDAFKAYQKELKTGFAMGASGGYFLWKNVGFGLTGELYKSAASMDDNVRKDAISIGYMGGTVVHRKVMQSKKGAVSTGFTMGYQRYKNAGSDRSQDFVHTGEAIGWGVNTGLDYRVGPKVAITVSASCLFGSLYKLTSESGSQQRTVKLNKDSSEDLSRISLTVGLKFF
jgi:hypothetical protein